MARPNRFTFHQRETEWRLPTKPDLDADPAVQLYRREKERRQSKPNPLMQEAARLYAKQLEDAQPHRKGRPRGVKSGAKFSDDALFQGIER